MTACYAQKLGKPRITRSSRILNVATPLWDGNSVLKQGLSDGAQRLGLYLLLVVFCKIKEDSTRPGGRALPSLLTYATIRVIRVIRGQLLLWSEGISDFSKCESLRNGVLAGFV